MASQVPKESKEFTFPDPPSIKDQQKLATEIEFPDEIFPTRPMNRPQMPDQIRQAMDALVDQNPLMDMDMVGGLFNNPMMQQQMQGMLNNPIMQEQIQGVLNNPMMQQQMQLLMKTMISREAPSTQEETFAREMKSVFVEHEEDKSEEGPVCPPTSPTRKTSSDLRKRRNLSPLTSSPPISRSLPVSARTRDTWLEYLRFADLQNMNISAYSLKLIGAILGCVMFLWYFIA